MADISTEPSVQSPAESNTESETHVDVSQPIDTAISSETASLVEQSMKEAEDAVTQAVQNMAL